MRDSYGKRNSLKTLQWAVFAREEAEAFSMESEYFFRSAELAHIFERMGGSHAKITSQFIDVVSKKQFFHWGG